MQKNNNSQNRKAQIAVVGSVGTGTSTLAKALQEIADDNNLNYKKVSGGTLMRNAIAEIYPKLTFEQAKYDLENSGMKGIEILHALDMATDNENKRIGENEEYIIVEARLSAHLMPNAFKVLLVCDTDTASGRTFKREYGYEPNISELKSQSETITKRNIEDNKRYKDLYDIDDIYDPKTFDLVIDSSHLDAVSIAIQVWSAYIKWLG